MVIWILSDRHSEPWACAKIFTQALSLILKLLPLNQSIVMASNYRTAKTILPNSIQTSYIVVWNLVLPFRTHPYTYDKVIFCEPIYCPWTSNWFFFIPHYKTAITNKLDEATLQNMSVTTVTELAVPASDFTKRWIKLNKKLLNQ